MNHISNHNINTNAPANTNSESANNTINSASSMVDFIRNYQATLEEITSLKAKVLEYRQVMFALENENKKLKGKIELTNDFIVQFIGQGCNTSSFDDKSFESLNKKFTYNKFLYTPNYISRNKISNPPTNISGESEPYSSVSSLTGFSQRLSDASWDTKEKKTTEQDSNHVVEKSENVVMNYTTLPI